MKGKYDGMKQTSEVMKLTGVSRKVLRTYKESGLVPPTVVTDTEDPKHGYGLYDDTAIQKIALIRVFEEAGYARKDIKKILDNPETDLVEEYGKLIDSLEEKKKRINGMISMVQTMIMLESLPNMVKKSLLNVNLVELLKSKNYSEALSNTIECWESMEKEDIKYAQIGVMFLSCLVSIGILKYESPKSQKVQRCIDEGIRYLTKKLFENQELLIDEIVEETEIMAEIGGDIIGDWLCDNDVIEYIELQAGKGAVEFIKEALLCYREQHNESNKANK